MAACDFLGLLLRRGDGFGLRLLQAEGLFFIALLLRIPLRHLPEVSIGVNPPSGGGRLR